MSRPQCWRKDLRLFIDHGDLRVACAPSEQGKRRSFTAKYKLEILAKADACTKPGEIGELLRREGLYTSHLTYWRKQVRDGALKELGKPRGPQAVRSARPGDRGADASG